MKKKDVLNLIRYHTEQNNPAFREQAYLIAKEFDNNGDSQISEYIVSLLSDANTFVPQANTNGLKFFKVVRAEDVSLPLPDIIANDVLGIINAVNHNLGVNKFIFKGSPGTGKTETVKQVARLLDRKLYQVDFDQLIDSRLGQTAKNISEMFAEINELSQPGKVVILFDEIDAIALDRTNNNDVREMGRATSAVLKGLDHLNSQIVLLATTNLFQDFDQALIRRFNAVVDFDRYSQDDLLEIAESILNGVLIKVPEAGRNVRLFRKILQLLPHIPYPGNLKNLIETVVAFSDPNDKFNYLKRLYEKVMDNQQLSVEELKKKGFTVREIEILTSIPKSTVSRELNEGK